MIAEDWLDRMTGVHNQIQHTLMQISNKRNARYLEKSREFQVGDMVLVDRLKLKVKAGDNRALEISGSAHER